MHSQLCRNKQEHGRSVGRSVGDPPVLQLALSLYFCEAAMSTTLASSTALAIASSGDPAASTEQCGGVRT